MSTPFYKSFKLNKRPAFEFIKIKSVFEDENGDIEDYHKEHVGAGITPVYGVYGIDFDGYHEHIADFDTLKDARDLARKLGANIP